MRRPYKRRDRRIQRQMEATDRQAEYDALSHDEKVARALAAPGFSQRQLSKLGVPEGKRIARAAA